MKIAHVVTLKESVPPISKNGLEFLVSWITEELVARGHEVTLFATGDSTTQAQLVSILPKLTSTDPLTKDGQPLFSIWNTIIAGIQSKNFDLIHCHDFFGPIIAPFISVPIIQTIHHPYRDEFLPKYIKDPRYRETLQPVIDQYSKINYVPISKNQETSFREMEPYYFKKYHTIYNGIPCKKFEFNDTPQDYLFYIGYINEDKGADTAVRIARAAGKKLIIAGNNTGEEEFFKKEIEPYLNDDIKYVGPVDFKQKIELYKNAYATLVPIRWAEPFGLILVESQACGTPVIAFNRGAAAEIVKDGETGFVVQTEKEMIEAVNKIDSLKRARCREWVEENFSVEKMVDEYEKLYGEILAKNKSNKE